MMRPCFLLSLSTQVTNTRIKICGITTPEDARLAAASGADAIGLVFYAPSSRAVTIEQAIAIVAAVPPFVTVVALVVDEPAESVRRIAESVAVDLIQFHGAEPVEFCQQFNRPWIKAVRVKPGVDIVAACGDYAPARGVLLDSWVDGVPGGTGKTFDWQLVEQTLSLPLIVAGGLNDRNVGAAIARLRPAAVDVSGGVEQSPGVKDPEKITRFIAAVRAADALLNGPIDDK